MSFEKKELFLSLLDEYREVKFVLKDQIVLILVKPYLDMVQKIKYIEEYLDNFYGLESVVNNYFIAEYALIMQIVDCQTDIRIENLDPDIVIRSGLWDEIRKSLINYDEFRKELNIVLGLYQEERRLRESVGFVLKDFVTKISNILENISKLDVETLRDVSIEFTEKLEELNNKVPGITRKPTKRKYTKKSKN